MSSSQVFARIVDGAIAEYPVTAIQIANRAKTTPNTHVYYEVVKDVQPVVPEYSTLKENKTVHPVHKKVFVQFEIVPMSLANLIGKVHEVNRKDAAVRKTAAETILFADIPPVLVQRISQAATAEAQRRLDAFAAERGYDNMAQAVSYANSTVAAWKADSERASLIRDQTWSAFYAYMSALTTGEAPVPRNVADIMNNLPLMTWA